MAPPLDSRTRVTQVTRLAAQNAKIPSRGFLLWGAIVEEVRTIFEQTNDATIYIPAFDIALNLH